MHWREVRCFYELAHLIVNNNLRNNSRPILLIHNLTIAIISSNVTKPFIDFQCILKEVKCISLHKTLGECCPLPRPHKGLTMPFILKTCLLPPINSRSALWIKKWMLVQHPNKHPTEFNKWIVNTTKWLWITIVLVIVMFIECLG